MMVTSQAPVVTIYISLSLIDTSLPYCCFLSMYWNTVGYFEFTSGGWIRLVVVKHDWLDPANCVKSREI